MSNIRLSARARARHRLRMLARTRKICKRYYLNNSISISHEIISCCFMITRFAFGQLRGPLKTVKRLRFEILQFYGHRLLAKRS